MTYNPSLNCVVTMGVVDGTTDADRLARPGTTVAVVDALSERYQGFLTDLMPYCVDYTWTGEKITTLAYRLCGTESAWLAILALNGLGTPMELRPGMVLRVPTASALAGALAGLNPVTGVLGQIVTI